MTLRRELRISSAGGYQKTPSLMTTAMHSWQIVAMDGLKPGQKIVVYTGQREELGEGTFLRREVHADMNVIAYECEEHTILAKGSHFVRVDGQLKFILDNGRAG